MKYFCDAVHKIIDADEKCLWELNKIPNPERNCAQCDHYISRQVPTKIETFRSANESSEKNYKKEDPQRFNDRIAERLSELAESKRYQEDFKGLIEHITSQKKIKISKLLTWHWPDEWDGDFEKVTEAICLSRFKKILKEGNVNGSWILIPDSYCNFKGRWQIDYFFDPSKSYPNDFCPFSFLRRPLVKLCYPPMSGEQYEKLVRQRVPGEGTDKAAPDQLRLVMVHWDELYHRWDEWNIEQDDFPYKLFLEIDVRGRLEAILNHVRWKVEDWQHAVDLPKTESRGRPETITRNLRKIRNILKTNPRLQTLKKAQQAKGICEELKRDGQGHKIQKPITIMRWYLPRLREYDKN